MKNLIYALTILLVASACQRETRVQTEQLPPAGGDQQGAASGPLGQYPTEEEMERQRTDPNWRQIGSIAQRRAEGQHDPSLDAIQVNFVRVTDDFGESVDELDPGQIDQLPLRVPMTDQAQGPSVFRAQVLLNRSNFGPGMIDGRWGKNTSVAVYFFQQTHGLETTGDIDEQTYRALIRRAGDATTVRQHQLTAEDVKGPFQKLPSDIYDQAELDCLCYESLSEKLSEQFHATIATLEKLNRGVDLNSAGAGTTIWVPNVRPEVGENAPKDIKRIVASVNGRYLHGFGEGDRLLFHAPTTVGSQYDPSPTETLQVTGIAHNPHFHFQPRLFHDRDDDDPEAHLNPGPNSPVGVVWMALSKPHYGIHGTRAPETIGYASSAGCVRLANWNAKELARRIEKGVSVEFVDT
jgi:lipoprotein-anchoring transpeptidase ErfK/SrfK